MSYITCYTNGSCVPALYQGCYTGNSYYRSTLCNSPGAQVCVPFCTPSGTCCNNICCQPALTAPNLCGCPSPNLAISYIASPIPGTAVVVPTGGVEIPVGSTTIPALGSVTLIGGFTGNAPDVNTGGITFNASTLQFTVPSNGVYMVSASLTFPITVPVISPYHIRLYIYKVNSVTGVISLVASQTAETTGTFPTTISVASQVPLGINDRIFFAVTQNSGVVMNIATTTDTRIGITRISST